MVRWKEKWSLGGVIIFHAEDDHALNREDSILHQPIEYLKGVGPARGELLRKELNIHRIGDLL